MKSARLSYAVVCRATKSGASVSSHSSLASEKRHCVKLVTTGGWPIAAKASPWPVKGRRIGYWTLIASWKGAMNSACWTAAIVGKRTWAMTRTNGARGSGTSSGRAARNGSMSEGIDGTIKHSGNNVKLDVKWKHGV